MIGDAKEKRRIEQEERNQCRARQPCFSKEFTWNTTCGQCADRKKCAVAFQNKRITEMVHEL